MNADAASGAPGGTDADGLVFPVRDQGRALEMLDTVMAGIAVLLHNLDPDERKTAFRAAAIQQAGAPGNDHRRPDFPAVGNR